MSSTGEVSAADLHNSLQLLAARMSAQGHPLEAIKCYVAMLSQSMLPSDEAAVRLRLGQLMMEHTLNMQDAKVHLQKAVSRRPLADAFYVTTYQPMATRFYYTKPSFMLVASCHLCLRKHSVLSELQEMLVMPLPGQHLLKCEVLAALATAHQSLGETDFQRRCYSKGLEVCKDPQAAGADRCGLMLLPTFVCERYHHNW